MLIYSFRIFLSSGVNLAALMLPFNKLAKILLIQRKLFHFSIDFALFIQLQIIGLVADSFTLKNEIPYLGRNFFSFGFNANADRFIHFTIAFFEFHRNITDTLV